MNILTDILKAVLKPLLEKYLATRKERKELERFYNTLISLSDKYISEHETEAVAHSESAPTELLKLFETQAREMLRVCALIGAISTQSLADRKQNERAMPHLDAMASAISTQSSCLY